jgi:hypothetical protein
LTVAELYLRYPEALQYAREDLRRIAAEEVLAELRPAPQPVPVPPG